MKKLFRGALYFFFSVLALILRGVAAIFGWIGFMFKYSGYALLGYAAEPSALLRVLPTERWTNLDLLELRNFAREQTLFELRVLCRLKWIDVRPRKDISVPPDWDASLFTPDRIRRMVGKYGFAEGLVRFHEIRVNERGKRVLSRFDAAHAKATALLA